MARSLTLTRSGDSREHADRQPPAPRPAASRHAARDRIVLVVALLASGVLHLGLAPEHAAHELAHALFLAAVGIGQVAVALILMRRPEPRSLTAAVILVGASITIWLLVVLAGDPFGHGDGDVDVGAAATKLLEVLALAAAVSALTRLSVAHRPALLARHRALGALAVALVLGSTAYVSAAALEREDTAAPVDSAPIAGPARGQAVSAEALTGDRLALVSAGLERPFENGSALPVAGDLSASVKVRPAAGRYARDVEVDLVRDGKPVDAASVTANGQMRFMDHGSFKQAAAPLGDGRYVVLARFAMPGEWRLKLDVDAGGEHGSINLDMDLFE